MTPSSEPIASDPGLDQLESLIETLADGLDGILSRVENGREPVDSDVVAGPSAQAQENRAIHLSRARLAADRAREARSELPELLDQVRSGLADVRRRRDERHAQGRTEHADVAGALGAAMSEVPGAEEPDVVLRGVVRGAVAGIPGVDLAAISLCDRKGRVLREIGSDPVADTLTARQAEAGEGPCLDVARTGEIVYVSDIASHRVAWSAFALAAVGAGVRSVLAFPLPTGSPVGSLCLWSRRPHVFDDSTREIGDLFVRHAALAVGGAEQRSHLQRALDSRDLIGQAKGVLMARRGVDADQAFRLLVRSSQDTNLKLVDVARWVAENLATP